MNLELIVRTYKMSIRSRTQSELKWFKEQTTLELAVEKAAMAICNCKGKRCSHQRRLKKENLEKAKRILLTNLSAIENSTTFDELYSLLEVLVRPISGIGKLYVYDTALRIGSKLGLLPTKVYLHAGTRTGAKRLGFESKESTIPVSRFPNVMQQLEPHEIEDVLCIFKDEFSKEETDSVDDTDKQRWC